MAKVITESQVRQILHDDYAVLDAVKNIFLEYIDGDAQMVSKVYLDISKGNDYRAMPAFNKKYACVKWIADYTSNVSNDFPTTQAIIILNDKSNGHPLAIIEANEITKLRTAAATALATRELVEDEKINKISFVGCGTQTLPHIRFLLKVLNEVEEISVYDVSPDRAKSIAKALPKTVVASSLNECVADSRVVTTLTPSTKPYLFRSMLPKICHVNAVGADAVGKRELGDDMFSSISTVVCDDYSQAKHSGEMQHFKPDSIFYRQLGYLLKMGEKNADGLTVYDSTGLAIEDLALAQYVFEKSVNFLDETKTI